MADKPKVGSTRACIQIDGDVLVFDEEFRREFLNGCTRRTASRYDKQGLPFTIVNGRKMRPVNAAKAWLASRIRRLSSAPS